MVVSSLQESCCDWRGLCQAQPDLRVFGRRSFDPRHQQADDQNHGGADRPGSATRGYGLRIIFSQSKRRSRPKS